MEYGDAPSIRMTLGCMLTTSRSDDCGTMASTCEAWVGDNPEQFANVNWKINSIKICTDPSGGSSGSNTNSGGQPEPTPTSTKSNPSGVSPTANPPSWTHDSGGNNGWGNRWGHSNPPRSFTA